MELSIKSLLWALAASPAPPSSNGSVTKQNSNDAVRVLGMYRYAVKGLSPDCLNDDNANRVHLAGPSSTFPNDRRYALLKEGRVFESEWLHKENFVCAFTHPRLLAKLQTTYNDDTHIITVRSRDVEAPSPNKLLLTAALNTETGRQQLGDLISELSGESVKCIDATSASNSNNNNEPSFQFGNTSSGWKQRQDTRTLHIVNQQTVAAVSQKLGISLNPLRFRPNIVVDAEPWSEFTDWVPNHRSLQVVDDRSDDEKDCLSLKVISKTVRCHGVSVDPNDPDTILDIPKLLNENFIYGPYLGVYAVTDTGGTLQAGDGLQVV